MMKYIETFFEEKDLPFAQWEIEDQNGTTHIINNEVVIEHIKIAPTYEQKGIADILRQIDFHNGDVNHFLHHLATALVNQY